MGTADLGQRRNADNKQVEEGRNQPVRLSSAGSGWDGSQRENDGSLLCEVHCIIYH